MNADTTTLDLGDGRSAVVRPSALLPNRVRRDAIAVYNSVADAGPLVATWAMFDVVLAWMVESWDLDVELPAVNPKVIDDLPVDVCNRLYLHCRSTDVMAILGGYSMGDPLDESSPPAASSE